MEKKKRSDFIHLNFSNYEDQMLTFGLHPPSDSEITTVTTLYCPEMWRLMKEKVSNLIG